MTPERVGVGPAYIVEVVKIDGRLCWNPIHMIPEVGVK